MSYLFNRLSYDVPFDGATYVNEADVSRVIPLVVTPQPDYINWLFQSNSSSLVSVDGAHTLTTASSFTPTYTSNSIILPAVATFNGLNTTYHDASVQTMTAVVKYTGEVSQILLGCLSSTVGEAITVSSTGVISYLYKNTSGTTVANTIPSPPISVGNYIFISFSRSGSSVIAMVGGASSVLSLTSAPKNVATTYYVGPGNTVFSTSGWSKSCEVMEFLYSPAAATATDLQAVYLNSKARCLARGKSII